MRYMYLNQNNSLMNASFDLLQETDGYTVFVSGISANEKYIRTTSVLVSMYIPIIIAIQKNTLLEVC